jgi:transcriptional regulator with XRE-family HTH domain
MRLVRRSRGLTQAALATAVGGLDRSEVSRIERGLEPSEAVRVRLAEALGVEPDRLLDRPEVTP